MKKIKLILKIIGIILLFILLIFLFIHFIFKINKEKVDASYLWNISYENLTFTEGSKEGVIHFNENALALNVTFEKEEEFYEFAVDMLNNGTLPAKITDIQVKIENEQNVLKTEIYNENKEELEIGDILNSKERKKIKIKISYPKQEKKIYDALNTKIFFQIEFSSIT